MKRRELDLVDVEVAIHDLAGIAVLVESVGHKIATVGSSKSDENAFNQIGELIISKQEILKEFFDDYVKLKKEVERFKKMKQ